MFNLGDAVMVRNEFGHESTGRVVHIDGRERDKTYWVCSSVDSKNVFKVKTPAMTMVEKCVPAKELKAKRLEEKRAASLSSLAEDSKGQNSKPAKPKKSKEEK